MSGLSRSRLKALILAGEVSIDGTTIRDPGHRVNLGNRIRLTIPPDEPAAPQGEPIPLNVVYEDGDISSMDDVMWAVLTRSRPDKDVMIIPETPSFYRDPHKEHWGRLGIDATVPFNRRREYERKNDC